MDITDIKGQFIEQDFQPESWQVIQDIFAQIESAGTITEEQIQELESIVEFEKKLEDATADAMEDMAGFLEERSEEIMGIADQTAEDVEEITSDLERALQA